MIVPQLPVLEDKKAQEEIRKAFVEMARQINDDILKPVEADQLTGTIPLANIPNDLTSKTATADGGNADTVDGYHVGEGAAKLNPIHGRLDGSFTEAQIYSALSTLIPNIGDWIPINANMTPPDIVYLQTLCFMVSAERTSAMQIRLNGLIFQGDRSSKEYQGISGSYIDISSTSSTIYSVSITY